VSAASIPERRGSAKRNLSDLLHEIDLQVITARQDIGDVVKELPAIRDTARRVTTIFDELPATASKVSDIHDELPSISGKITAIHDDMPAMSDKVTLIYDELPAIHDALARLAVHLPCGSSGFHLLIVLESYYNKLISLHPLPNLLSRDCFCCPSKEMKILLDVKTSWR
jgi:hypothetical protein